MRVHQKRKHFQIYEIPKKRYYNLATDLRKKVLKESITVCFVVALLFLLCTETSSALSLLFVTSSFQNLCFNIPYSHVSAGGNSHVGTFLNRL